MDSEEEAGVYVANEESYHVSCQGCGSDRDDGDPFAISAVWHHARCVGRWSDIQCDQPFSCDGCKQAEVQSQRRATKSKNAGRPCTPRYQPPGCAGGRGCDKGMNPPAAFVVRLQSRNVAFVWCMRTFLEQRGNNNKRGPRPG